VLWATVLLTLLAGVVTWWLTWQMLRRQFAPVMAATRSLTAQVDSGQLADALPVARNDEIGELIGGFNRMLAVLGQRSRALQESESYNKVLFAGSHIPLAVLDPATGALVDCNQAALDIYQIERRETLLAMTPADLSTPEQYDGRDSALAAKEHIEPLREAPALNGVTTPALNAECTDVSSTLARPCAVQPADVAAARGADRWQPAFESGSMVITDADADTGINACRLPDSPRK
jgi:HAMP domain-containing protein